MAQPVVTRSQRRNERKQVGLIIALIITVAGVSFGLGYLYGQRGGTSPGLAVEIENPTLPAVAQITPPPQPAPEDALEKPEPLTFYENLPKGNQAPLGSGINLPPERKTVAAAPKQDSKPAASQPVKPVQKAVSAPAAGHDGDFVVQIASFRTQQDAAKLSGRLKTYKLTTYVEAADLGEKGVWHRVLAGPYTSRESADKTAKLLREKERLSALVRQR